MDGGSRQEGGRGRPVWGRAGLVLLATFAAASAPLAAQTRASERGRVSQVVNGTTITLDYARPVARGRENLFGGVVHWGEMWTPGANWATTLEVDRPVRINGYEVSAGIYSVWMQPQLEEWTVFLNRDTRLYHDAPVPEEANALRFTVVPSEGSHMEALAWYFPSIGPRDAELRMHWGSTYVPLTIETEAFTPPPVAAGLRARYAGAYEMEGRDPTTGGPFSVTITVVDEADRLSARWGRAPIWLSRAGEHEFYLGFLREGELFDMGDEMTLRLIPDGDAFPRAEMLWMGEPFARGERVPLRGGYLRWGGRSERG